VEESVKIRALNEVLAEAEILLSRFGADASLIGAAALVIQAIIANPSRIENIP